MGVAVDADGDYVLAVREDATVALVGRRVVGAARGCRKENKKKERKNKKIKTNK